MTGYLLILERICSVASTNHNRMLNRDQPLLNVSGSMRLLLACLMGVFSILQWVLPVAFFLRTSAAKYRDFLITPVASDLCTCLFCFMPRSWVQ